MRSCLLLVALAAVAAACGDGTALPAPDAAPVACNPVIGDDCVTPFPSSFQTVADPSTATGVRVALRPDRLPISRDGNMLDATRFNRRDGFSAATPFFAYFKEGVSLTGLPDQSNAGIDSSVLPTSKVQIINAATGARVPLFVELDANAQPWDRQAFIIRPMVRLEPATRYLIALVGLSDAAGAPLLPAPFRALRDHLPLDPATTAPLAALYEDIFAKLESFGVARGSLTLAWDMTTGSDAQVHAHLIGMRDTALAMVDSGALGYTITSAVDTPDRRDGMREILATVQVPSYLASDEPTAPLNIDADGTPKVRAVVDVPIIIEIPKCAATASAPIPFLIFGHGLFLDSRGQLPTPGMLWIANTQCVALVATDMMGLSSSDLPGLGSLATDFDNVYFVTDHLQQAQTNMQVMTRLLGKLAADPALAAAGKPLVDGAQRYYFGISNGGVQGATLLALSPDIERGVLNVPGGNWNLMMFRSVDFAIILPLLGIVYTDALDRQMLIALSQFEWDYTEPLSFAKHILGDPLPGSFAKKIIIQESIGDSQVPNLATRLLARTIGVGALPLVQPVTGISESAGPLPSAYTQWDTHRMPLPPPTNIPAPEDNGAHEGILGFDVVETQMKRFLKPGGQVEDTCGGPCSALH